MNHINPNNVMVATQEKVDPEQLAWLHIYSQPCEHFTARIVGNKMALEILKSAIEKALKMPINPIIDSPEGYIVSDEVFATDGEGYEVAIKLMPDNPNKRPMVFNVWDYFEPHYCSRGYNDDTHRSDV